MLLRILILLCCGFPLLLPGQIYMTVEGVMQGTISDGASTQSSLGELAVPGHEDEILVLAYEQKLNTNTGTATANSISAEELIIKKYTDRTSPLLARALADAERVSVQLEFYRTNPFTNQPEAYFRITMPEAIITAFRPFAPQCDDCNQHFEEVSFDYSSVQYEHLSDGTQSDINLRQ